MSALFDMNSNFNSYESKGQLTTDYCTVVQAHPPEYVVLRARARSPTPARHFEPPLMPG